MDRSAFAESTVYTLHLEFGSTKNIIIVFIELLSLNPAKWVTNTQLTVGNELLLALSVESQKGANAV